MFDGLASAFIDAISEIMRPAGDLAEQRDRGEDSVRLAIAALLTHVAHVDGVLHDKETAALETMLAERFSLGETAARQIAHRLHARYHCTGSGATAWCWIPQSHQLHGLRVGRRSHRFRPRRYQGQS